MIQGCCQNEFRDAEPILMLDDPSRMAMMSMSWEEQDYYNGIKSFLNENSYFFPFEFSQYC